MAVHGRRAGRPRAVLVGLLLASLITITTDFRAGDTGPLAGVGRTMLGLITPLQEAVAAVFRPVGAFFSTLTQAQELKVENARLRAEVAQLRGNEERVATLVRENADLKALLRIAGESDYETIGARVIGESVSNFEWAVWIDKGSGDGVKEDMPVEAVDGLVGRVVQVTGTAAKVMLIRDPGSAVAVRLARSKERGLLVGQGEGSPRMDLVDAETVIRGGEVIETSGYRLRGEQGLFPPGIPVGVVSLSEPDPVSLGQRVLVRPYVDFSSLDAVLVVVPPPSQAVAP